MEFTYVHTETCTQMFIAVSFLTAPNWKQSRWPSTAKGSTNCATTPQNTVAAAAKLLQSCLTLCDPWDGSPPGSPVPGILQARTLEWVAISFYSAWNWKVKVKSLSHIQQFATTEYYSAIKKNKQLIHTTTWMDLQRIHWMKKVKPERLHTVWFHLYDILKKQMYRNRTDLFDQWKCVSINCVCPPGDIWVSKELVLPNSSHIASTLRSTTRRT